jgi:phosphoribosylformimino-5-aminoimidazole carboxamide ribotide isomerase
VDCEDCTGDSVSAALNSERTGSSLRLNGKRLGDPPKAAFNDGMKVIPVLDLMGGVVVRGAGGRRREYRPVVSRLTASPAPLDVARAFRERFGLTELYVADLDAIEGAPPALPTLAALRAAGFRLWVDAGVRDIGRARTLAEAGVERVVVGLETAGPGVLAEACGALGDRVVFSLDLKAGVPFIRDPEATEPVLGGGMLSRPGQPPALHPTLGGAAKAWHPADASGIAERAVALGARRLLVLDLARVGGGAGVGTEALCARLAAAHPEVEVAVGGGVRGADDLRRLAGRGVRAALVASALHDGALKKADIEEQVNHSDLII